MGRHVLKGELATTLWNQPYNGALDAYLLAPLLALLPHHAAYRLYQLACAALLVLLAGRLAHRVGGRAAGWAAAFLAACGTPYMALMTATGPPPNFLMPLVTGFPLLAALAATEQGTAASCRRAHRLGPRLRARCLELVARHPGFRRHRPGPAAGWLAAAPARLRRSSWRVRAAGAAPLLVARAIGASGAKVVTASSAVTALRPRWLWLQGVHDLWGGLVGLAGLQVPLVVDGPRALIAAAGARGRAGVGAGGWRGHRCAARAGRCRFWAGPRRCAAPSGSRGARTRTSCATCTASTCRCWPCSAAGLPQAWRWRRVAGLALGAALVVPWGWGEHELVRHWRDPAHAERVWEVPALAPSLEALSAAGARSAYASLQFAGRLTLETRRRGGRQPGVERAHPRRPAALPRRGRPRPGAGLGALAALLARHAARRRLP